MNQLPVTTETVWETDDIGPECNDICAFRVWAYGEFVTSSGKWNWVAFEREYLSKVSDERLEQDIARWRIER